MAPMTFQLEEFSSFDAAGALRESWNALAEITSTVSVFSTWEWQSTWWKYYGGGKSLRIVAVRKAERLVGLLPLHFATTPLVSFLSMREARLVGSGGDTSPDYLGPLLAPEHEAEVAKLLADYVVQRRREWDVLNFTDVCEGAFSRALQEALRERDVEAVAKPCSRIQIVRLPATWDEYVGAMPRDRRYRLRNLRRKAEEKVGARFQTLRTVEELRGAVAELIDLHRSRWDSKDHTKGAFRTESYVGFHTEAIDLCQRNDWIRFYRIEVAGEAAAMFYCYRYRDEVLYFQSGFDPKHEQHSLGQVLMGRAIESALAEGAGVFDLLKGEHAYKASWANDFRYTIDLVAHNTSSLGRLSRIKERLREWKHAMEAKRAAARKPTPEPVAAPVPEAASAPTPVPASAPSSTPAPSQESA
jgi:CelD/BcsL family acetyltransferase involved in cellulose biosynthesis